MDLTKQARDRECQVRLPGICNGERTTTVLCHFRLIGISGFGFKPRDNDLIAAWACFSCHTYVDTHKDAQTQLEFAKGVFRTQAKLVEEGKVKW